MEKVRFCKYDRADIPIGRREMMPTSMAVAIIKAATMYALSSQKLLACSFTASVADKREEYPGFTF